MIAQTVRHDHSAQSSNGRHDWEKIKRGREVNQVEWPEEDAHQDSINANGNTEKSEKRLLRRDARESLRGSISKSGWITPPCSLGDLKTDLPESFDAIATDRRTMREHLKVLAQLAERTHPDECGRRVAVPPWVVRATTAPPAKRQKRGGNRRSPGRGLPAIIAAQALYWQEHGSDPWRTTFDVLSRQVGVRTDRKGHKTLMRALDALAERDLISYSTGKDVGRVPLDRADSSYQAALLEYSDPRRLIGIDVHLQSPWKRHPLLDDPPPISKIVNLVKVAAVEVLGANGAILLTRLMYLHRQAGRPVKATYEDLAETTGLSIQVVRSEAESLLQQGLVRLKYAWRGWGLLVRLDGRSAGLSSPAGATSDAASLDQGVAKCPAGNIRDVPPETCACPAGNILLRLRRLNSKTNFLQNSPAGRAVALPAVEILVERKRSLGSTQRNSRLDAFSSLYKTVVSTRELH